MGVRGTGTPSCCNIYCVIDLATQSPPSQFLGKVLVVSRSFNSFLVRAVDVGW